MIKVRPRLREVPRAFRASVVTTIATASGPYPEILTSIPTSAARTLCVSAPIDA